MSSERYGVYTMMADRFILRNLLILIGLFVFLMSCQSDKSDKSEQTGIAVEEGHEKDIEDIQAMLTEAITRWRYGDKAVLYENEFEYLRYEMTFDEYLKNRVVEIAEADTVVALNVISAIFYDHDSADCDVEIVFRGPAEIETYDTQMYRQYHSSGRWIRPYISRPEKQREFEKNKRIADSAAEAESEGEDW